MSSAGCICLLFWPQNQVVIGMNKMITIFNKSIICGLHTTTSCEDKRKKMYLSLHCIIKPLSHCADVATGFPDARQPVYRDAPGHIS